MMTCPDSDTFSFATNRERFDALWQRCLIKGAENQGAAVHKTLVDAYCEPQRVYHALAHIEHCLSMFDTVAERLGNPDAVELAIWFHDVVYQPGAPDNEQRSADQFMAQTHGIFDDSLRRTVYDHIMATLHNGTEIINTDAQYMVDIDLSSFGMPWRAFMRDSENVRKEMHYLSDADFYPKQAVFQKCLLDQPQFFKTDYFFNKYEAQARQNLAEYSVKIREKVCSK